MSEVRAQYPTTVARASPTLYLGSKLPQNLEIKKFIWAVTRPIQLGISQTIFYQSANLSRKIIFAHKKKMRLFVVVIVTRHKTKSTDKAIVFKIKFFPKKSGGKS